MLLYIGYKFARQWSSSIIVTVLLPILIIIIVVIQHFLSIALYIQ